MEELENATISEDAVNEAINTPNLSITNEIRVNGTPIIRHETNTFTLDLGQLMDFTWSFVIADEPKEHILQLTLDS
ncbi:hypothetical protein JTB14_036926 [Gonioctena quinquepunctata]|nr:hypothetical protein JTB14_036926 [Gonioctena quinquepunctata]